MAIRIPKIIQSKKFLGRSLSNGSRSSSSIDIIPKGHFAVYVGDQEKSRFVVPLSLLEQPSFQDLLRQSEEEFGYNHPMGGLTIPCREDVFIDVACRVDEDDYPWRLKKGNILKFSHDSVATKLQLAQCITDVMVGSRTLIGGILSRSGLKRAGSIKYLDYSLTPIQEKRLHRLQERLNVPFEEESLEHQKALIDLWYLAYPDVKLQGLTSEQWKDMGWQGVNPSTDFRGCGLISLENLLFFAKKFPDAFHRLLFKQSGDRATWEYPFAAAGVNISYMLIQMLDLYSVKPTCLPGANFLKFLEETEEAFDILYCVTFALMDAQWLAMRASYMEFKEVLQVTRAQLERELSLEDIYRIEDLPAYNMLDSRLF